MNQFLAILKDSFREAVDGFVIYIMLGLTGLLLLVMASLSLSPAPAADVLPDFVKRFSLYVPEQGKARPVAVDPDTTYKADDIRTAGAEVTFRLTARGTTFRQAVAAWLKPAGPAAKLTPSEGRPRDKQQRQDEAVPEVGLEVVTEVTATPAEAAAVSDEQMAAFVADQFRTHLGATGVRVRRLSGPDEPEFAFEVTLPRASSARGWPQDVALFFGAWQFGRFPLGPVVQVAEDNIVNGIGAWVTLLIGVVITAFFIPNMLRKGAVDLLLARPIGRGRLLVYKYIGGLTFMFLLSVAAVGGTWLVLGLRSGHWNPLFLLVIPLLCFTFALLYAVSTVTAVFTRNAIAAILITLTFSIVLGLVGHFKTLADEQRNTGNTALGTWPAWVFDLADTLNDVLPRYKDLDKLSSRLTAEGNLTPLELKVLTGRFDFPSWAGAVGQTLGYITLFLALAVWRFKTRDY
jgi:ABC-type transport system involved in multi-copper enzyme maturation permease subunit